MTRQIKESPSRPALLGSGGNAAKSLFAAGGLLAAFGVASCCALPVALSLLGVSAASLLGIGYLAAEYQQELFYAAVILLATAVVIMWRQRRTLACAPSWLNWGSSIALVLATGLLALTFWIEPPI
jgi:mercuric ion transport protein